MKITVMGAGGIGGYVGGRLAEAGHDVELIARGAHLEAMRSNGLTIISPEGDAILAGIRATDDPAQTGVADIVIFATKLKDTEDAARRLKPVVGPGTRIVTLQNGIDSRSLIGHHLPEAQIAAGVIYISVFVSAPGVITHPGGPHRIVVDDLAGDPVIAGFLDACAAAKGLEAEGNANADRVIWEKFIALSALAAITGITRLPLGAVYANPRAKRLFRDLILENIAVARARGMDFPDAHADKVIEVMGGFPFGLKSSMLLDLEAGRPLELPWLAGRIDALGQELGVPTPCNATIHAALAPFVDGAPALAPGGQPGAAPRK